MPTVEERLSALEAEVERLKRAQVNGAGNQPWWKRVSGKFKDDPAFEEAVRLGREWREAFRPRHDDEVAPL